MEAIPTIPRTPITRKADRSDERIRLIEESVLLVRGDWPAVAYGLCETVNRATGLIIAPPGTFEETIARTADEAVRVVEGLYGHDAALEVQRLAASGPPSEPAEAEHAARHRLRVPSLRNRRRIRVRIHR